jgi:iturin family lipopeptide synthetase A
VEFIGEAAALSRAIGTHAGVEVAHVIPVRRVPKTTSGKVQRHLLVRQYAEGEFDEVLAEIAKLAGAPAPDVPPRSEIERALAGVFAGVETGKTMGIDDNFFEVGLSSLDLVQVFSQIDERWPGAIDITEIFDYPTIVRLAARLEETLTASAKARGS